MILNKKLLLRPNLVLADEPFPANPQSGGTVGQVTAGMQCVIDCESGWYRVQVRAGAGGAYAGAPGAIEHYVYLHRGATFLIWGASGSVTYYPDPTGGTGEAGALGGGGAIIWTNQPGGGGAGGNGTAYGGGGGAGFIAGINTYQPTTTESWTVDTDTFHFSVDTVVAMVLCGGGGAGAGEGFLSDAGGGGGAWGDGGDNRNRQGGAGPGGDTFGRGGNSTAGTGGAGAWCIRDYSTNTFLSGTGTGTSGLEIGTVRVDRILEG